MAQRGQQPPGERAPRQPRERQRPSKPATNVFSPLCPATGVIPVVRRRISHTADPSILTSILQQNAFIASAAAPT